MERSAKVMKSRPAADVLRRAALLFVLAGGISSLALTFWMGRRNSSPVLVLLFLGWVASPFVALHQAHRVAGAWTAARQKNTYKLMFLVSVGSVFVCAWVVLQTHLAKPAGPFLIVPLASWFLIAAGLWIGSRIQPSTFQADRVHRLWASHSMLDLTRIPGCADTALNAELNEARNCGHGHVYLYGLRTCPCRF